jgi:ferredoxin
MYLHLQASQDTRVRGNCPMNEPMRLSVHVDRERCQGHSRCYAIAPELFELDDLGNSREVGDGLVPPELQEKARLAVANCPEEAITIHQA